jgi:hypothetical protein
MAQLSHLRIEFNWLILLNPSRTGEAEQGLSSSIDECAPEAAPKRGAAKLVRACAGKPAHTWAAESESRNQWKLKIQCRSLKLDRIYSCLGSHC